MRALLLALALLANGAATAESRGSLKGIWKTLVQPGRKWVLHDTIAADRHDPEVRLVIETYDVRTVRAARVARLRWTVVASDMAPDDVGNSNTGLYTQVAVTDAGLYLLSAEMNDAKIAEALRRKPSRSDPPRPYKGTMQNQGRYLTVERDTVCLGQGPTPDAGDCEDTCDGQLCITADVGITEVSGSIAPFFTIFR